MAKIRCTTNMVLGRPSPAEFHCQKEREIEDKAAHHDLHMATAVSVDRCSIEDKSEDGNVAEVQNEFQGLLQGVGGPLSHAQVIARGREDP